MATRKIAVPVAPVARAAKPSSLTEQQHAAIHRRDVSIALSAGAGCGKTFVLTERFLAHLQPAAADQPPPAELKELIAITFTERAAREMRQRIRAKCLQRLQDASEADVAYWTRLLRELDAARVSTIHSFCASILRAHAAEAGLDPGFGLLDPVQAETVLTEAADDVFRELLSAHDETTLDLCVQFGLETVRNMTASLLGARQEIDFSVWLARPPEQIVAEWARQHREVFLPALLHELAESAAVQELLRLLPLAQCDHPKMLVQLATLAERLPQLASATNPPTDLQQLRDATMLQGFGTKKNWADVAFYEQYSACAKKLRGALDQALGCCQFDAAAVLPDAIAGQQILSIAQNILLAFDERKRQLGLLDFDDLLIRAAHLLRDHPQLVQRLTRQVKLLLVDEFQDTDPLQVSLVKALCGEGLQTGKLFFVGDFKQSIYRFRGAKPAVFRDLENQMPPRGRLPLTLNFRSQPAVLHFVNALFQGAFGESYAPLQAHRPQRSPLPSVEFLWAVTGLSTREGGATQAGRWQEADAIARRIRQLLDDGLPRVIDAENGSEELRPARPGDIAILFRALSDVAHYERALQDHGIDYYLVGGHAFYAQQEIFDLLNLLRTLASPADEVSLAGVLRSPMFALADETLFWLSRHASGLTGGLFAATALEQLDAEQQRRVAFAAETIRYLRQRKDRLPIAGLIDEALQRTGYDAVLLAEFLGARKLANLQKLISQARACDQTGALGLADFIVQLADLVAEQPKEALAATHPESSQVVRLMSIHQSKGLEFPIVVVADIDRKKNSSSDSIAFSPQLGPLVRAPSARKNADLFSGLDLFKQENRAEEDREQTRLLYVATTRAADLLILSSGLTALDQLQGPWTKLLAERFDLSSGQCVATLPADYVAPHVGVLMPAAKPPGKRSAADSIDWEKLWLEIQRDGQAEKIAFPLVAPVEHRAPLRQEYSFSRLHGETKSEARAEPMAADLGEDVVSERVDAIDLGTLVHGVLEEVDFAQPGDLDALLQRHAQRHPSSLDDVLPVALKLLEKFLASRRAATLAGAAQMHRELEFLLAWPLAETSRGTSLTASQPKLFPDANLRLTGVIDCLYCDVGGQWHLLDYKTNQVSATNLADVADGYRLQMSVYALAVETILQQSPASLTLHFLRSGHEHVFPWNDQVREEAIALVNQSLTSVV